MPKETILVVDDEEDILELIEYNLAKEGYDVVCVSTGEDALKKARSKHPDAVLLDLMLPGLDGLEVCKMLKGDPKTAGIPILMLTAKDDETDIVIGLEMGADDYITKPFSTRVLTARLKSVLRRAKKAVPDEKQIIKIHDIEIHPQRHEVLFKGKPIDLTLTEFQILHFLARRPGWVFSRYQIVEAIHGDEYPVTDRAVDVQIVGLRRKLGPAGNRIETVRGVGYRFKEAK